MKQQMAMQELTQMEVMEVSGGRRNLGTEYEYTGDPKDRNFSETVRDMVNDGLSYIFSFGWLER